MESSPVMLMDVEPSELRLRPEIYSSRGGSRDFLSRVVQVFGQGDSETASDNVGPYYI